MFQLFFFVLRRGLLVRNDAVDLLEFQKDRAEVLLLLNIMGAPKRGSNYRKYYSNVCPHMATRRCVGP